MRGGRYRYWRGWGCNGPGPQRECFRMEENMISHKNQFFHASQTPDIGYLEPRVSNHGIPLIYFSAKRENTLVYLSNAVEKYCKETGYIHHGKWQKWASYGFAKEGILRLEEYYPNATVDTYKGVSGYIYSAAAAEDMEKMSDIPFGFVSKSRVKVEDAEYIPDAYDSIMEAVERGEIILRKYEDLSEAAHKWIHDSVIKEYETASEEYRYFLKGKFDFLNT